MKNFTFFAFIISLLLLASCKTNYYQISEIETESSLTNDENQLIYENEDLTVSYDFWSNNGKADFNIYNKTNENLIIDLTKSFLIINDKAFDYFQNRIFTDSYATSVATPGLWNVKTVGVSSNQTVGYEEKNTMIIPPNSYKTISEYTLGNDLYSDCDYELYPSRKEIKTQNFNKENSPIRFSNRVSYKLGTTEANQSFENKFYISSITNYPEKEIFENKKIENCNSSFQRTEYINTQEKPNRFYVKYSKEY